MKTFLVFIGTLILVVNIILIIRVIYTYAIVWMDMHTSLQTKKYIPNYEKLANNIFDNLKPNKELTISVALKFNGRKSNVAYEEKHMVTTDGLGAFSFQLGDGKITKGNYKTLLTGGAGALMKISINGPDVNDLHGDYTSLLSI